MFMDGCQRGEIEAAPDFFQARRVAVVLDELIQVIEDFTLPFGEREHFIPPVDPAAPAAGPRLGRGGETIMRTEGEDQATVARSTLIALAGQGCGHALRPGDAGPTLEKPAPEKAYEASIVGRGCRAARVGGRGVAESHAAGRCGDFQ